MDYTDEIKKRANKYFTLAIINTFAVAPGVFAYGIVFLMFTGLKYGGPEASDYFLQYVFWTYLFASVITFIAATINKCKPGIFYGKAILIVFISIILGFLLSYWNLEIIPKEEEKKIKEEMLEKERKLEEERKREEKEKKEEKENYLNHLKNRLSEFGYISTNCDITRENHFCFTNNEWKVTIEDDFDLYFIKSVNFKEINSYDTTSDLAYIDDILETNNKYVSLSSSNNTMFSLLFNKTINNFHLEVNNIKTSISQSKSTITYSIDSAYKQSYDSFNKVNLDIILNNTNLYNVRKELYDLALSYNKDYFKFYDYPYMYFNESSNNNVCTITFSENKKTSKSSYCNGGTSNTYFDFSENKAATNDFIEIYIREKYFNEMYLDIINNDLNYISNKTGFESILDDANKEQLTNYVNNKDKKLNLIINDHISIDLEYRTNYFVKYIIK